jgi:hypothetical protein
MGRKSDKDRMDAMGKRVRTALRSHLGCWSWEEDPAEKWARSNRPDEPASWMYFIDTRFGGRFALFYEPSQATFFSLIDNTGDRIDIKHLLESGELKVLPE